jgi:CHAD domain-containing protein
VRKAARKARARLAVAVERDEPALLHRARKAVKRARYATELVQPLRGKGAKRKIKRYKRVQDVLGEHQDSIVAAGILRGLATRSAEANSAGFTLGLLYGIEQAAGREARRRAGELKL